MKRKAQEELEQARHELGRWQKKAAEQQRELKELRAGFRELEELTRAVLVQAALSCGERTENGGAVLTLPRVAVGSLRRYELRTRQEQGGYGYVLEVRKREK